MNKEKIYELNFFRALACISILLYHYTTRYNELYGHLKIPYFSFKYGYVAVAMFFILSGFLISLKIPSLKSAKQFFVNRFLKIYPTYLIAMIITTLFLVAFGGATFSNRVVSIKEFILNLTCFSNWMGVKSVDGVYWTLSVEIVFYFLIFILIVLKKQDKLLKYSAYFVVLSLIINTVSLFVNNKVLSIISVITISQYIHMFVIGIYLQKIYQNNKIDFLSVLVLLMCCLNQYISQGFVYTLFLIIIIIVFYLIVCRRIKLPMVIYKNKFVDFFANISYPLYLLHQFIGFVIIYKMESIGLTSEVALIIPITISISLAFLVHYFIENKLCLTIRKKIIKY